MWGEKCKPQLFLVLERKERLQLKSKQKVRSILYESGFPRGVWSEFYIKFAWKYSSLQLKIKLQRYQTSVTPIPSQAEVFQGCRGKLDSGVHINFNKNWAFRSCR